MDDLHARSTSPLGNIPRDQQSIGGTFEKCYGHTTNAREPSEPIEICPGCKSELKVEGDELVCLTDRCGFRKAKNA